MMSQNEVRACQPILHCAQEERWVVTNLGSVSFDLCASQAAVQDVEAEMRFQVRLSPKMVCSDQPEGCVLSCLNSPVSQGIPAMFEGLVCQYKHLPFGHLSQLGFRVNWGKSKLVLMQRISFFSMK